MQRLAAEGGGHHERRLLTERAKLEDQVCWIEKAEAASHRLLEARQTITEGRQCLAKQRRQERAVEHELTSLRPWQRARRRALTATLTDLHERQERLSQQLAPIRARGPALDEAARQAAAQAPPSDTWPQIRRRHAELLRAFDVSLHTARERDVVRARVHAHEQRRAQNAAQHELTAIQRETIRRIDLAPDERDLEHLSRAEYATSRRAGTRQKTGPHAHGGIEQRGPSPAYQPPRHPIDNEPHRGHGLSR